jgi:hypothetical protein
MAPAPFLQSLPRMTSRGESTTTSSPPLAAPSSLLPPSSFTVDDDVDDVCEMPKERAVSMAPSWSTTYSRDVPHHQARGGSPEANTGPCRRLLGARPGARQLPGQIEPSRYRPSNRGGSTRWKALGVGVRRARVSTIIHVVVVVVVVVVAAAAAAKRRVPGTAAGLRSTASHREARRDHSSSGWGSGAGTVPDRPWARSPERVGPIPWSPRPRSAAARMMVQMTTTTTTKRTAAFPGTVRRAS